MHGFTKETIQVFLFSLFNFAIASKMFSMPIQNYNLQHAKYLFGYKTKSKNLLVKLGPVVTQCNLTIWPISNNTTGFHSLWCSDTIWWHRSGSTWVQLMACCLMAPSHYLNQCWLISMRSFHIHLRAISQEMLMITVLDMSLKITDLIW